MKKSNKISHELLFVISIIVILTQSGCTAVGYLLGSGIDNARNNFTLTSNNKLNEIDPGREIKITSRDGAEKTGFFVAFGKFSFDTIQKIYDDYCREKALVGSLPFVGDTVQIYYKQSKMTLRGCFLATDIDEVFFRKPEDAAIFSCMLDPDFVTLSIGDEEISMQALKQAPSLDYIRIKDRESDLLQIPLYSIKEIAYLKKQNKWRYIGAITGCIVDVTIVVITIYNAIYRAMDEVIFHI